MQYKFTMPAVRGNQCGREYYVGIVPFGLLPRLFLYNEEFVPPEVRAQRPLNQQRVPEIANYILYNDDWLFSSLTATISGEVDFIPFDERNPDAGTLQVDMNASFFINDGQHRRAGIIEAMKQNPGLSRETISVVIYKDEGLERSNQMFADLNRYAQKPTKSLNVLYDARDPLSSASSEMVKQIEIFDLFTDKDRVSLASKSPKLFTLGSIYEANKYLLRINRKKLREFTAEDEGKIIAYWEQVVQNMPVWEMAKRGDLKTWELREEYICTHSVIIQALGMVGSYLWERSDWQKDLEGLRRIDWRRSNPEWKGITIGGNGRVVNSKPVVNLSAVLIRKKLGLKISPAEEKELESVRV